MKVNICLGHCVLVKNPTNILGHGWMATLADSATNGSLVSQKHVLYFFMCYMYSCIFLISNALLSAHC